MNLDNYRAIIGALDGGLCKPLPRAVVNANGCWIPQGITPTKEGYTRIGRYVQGKPTMALLHTLSWFMHNREWLAGRNLPPDACVRHMPVCGDDKSCFNPAHLRLGDTAANMRDRAMFGRQANSLAALDKGRRSRRGKPNLLNRRASPHRKLTAAQLDAVRAALAAGDTHRAIARRFGVANSTITRINTGKAYAHAARQAA